MFVVFSWVPWFFRNQIWNFQAPGIHQNTQNSQIRESKKTSGDPQNPNSLWLRSFWLIMFVIFSWVSRFFRNQIWNSQAPEIHQNVKICQIGKLKRPPRLHCLLADQSVGWHYCSAGQPCGLDARGVQFSINSGEFQVIFTHSWALASDFLLFPTFWSLSSTKKIKSCLLITHTASFLATSSVTTPSLLIWLRTTTISSGTRSRSERDSCYMVLIVISLAQYALVQ